MTRKLQVACTILAVTVAMQRIGAQQVEPFSEGERRLVNYAFATQLGSGVYSVGGRTVQVYRLPFSYSVREESEEGWGFIVTFPVTFGFYDFRSSDVLQEGLPDNLDTASLVPGVEFRLLAGERWLLKPFANAGVVKERSSSTGAYVFGVGLRSIAEFPAKSFALTLGNELDYWLVDASGTGSDDLLSFEASFQARHALGLAMKSHELDYGLYGALFLYFDDPQFPLADGGNGSIDDQYEAGVTFGTKEEARIWKFPVPRLGLGYRFGEGISAVRFVIGIPVPSLKR